MIRFLFTNAFIVFFTIICAIYSLFLSLLDKKARIMHFYAIVPWARIILRVCGIKLRVKGLENIIRGRPYIFMSNHMSYVDIFALFAALPVDFKYILKKELMKIPLFGFSVRRAQHISLNRTNPREAIKSVNEAAARIRKGTSVVIFPEGTRSDGRILPFKRGGFQLALKSGCDIIPLAIENTQNIVPKKSRRIKRGTVYIQIGHPLTIDGYSKRNLGELVEKTRSIIIQMKKDLMKKELEGTDRRDERHQKI